MTRDDWLVYAYRCAHSIARTFPHAHEELADRGYDAGMRAVARIDATRPDIQIRAYIRKTVRGGVFDAWRKVAKRQEVPLESRVLAPVPAPLLDYRIADAKQIRHAMGLTIQEVAFRAQVPRSRVAILESRDNPATHVSVEVMGRVADVLGVDHEQRLRLFNRRLAPAHRLHEGVSEYKTLRVARGYTAKRWSKALGYSQHAVSEHETGRFKPRDLVAYRARIAELDDRDGGYRFTPRELREVRRRAQMPGGVTQRAADGSLLATVI